MFIGKKSSLFFRALTRLGGPLSFGIATSLVLAALWVVVVMQIDSDRKTALHNAQSQLANVARSFKEHSQNSIRNADETLRVIKYHHETRGKGDRALLNDYFYRGVIDTGFFNQAGIIDAQGQYVFSNLQDHKVIDLSDREHFRVHKDGYSYPLYLSKVVFGRASRKWSIQLTRRLEKPDGSFDGVAVVSFDPTYFLNFHRRIDLGTHGFTAFLDLDGVVRTLRAGSFSTVEGLKAPLALPTSVQSEASGTFESDRLYDGVHRLYAFERLSNQPLLVVVGMDMQELLAEHESHRFTYLAFATGLTLVLVLLAVGGVVTLRRSARLNADLLRRTQEAGTANRHKTEFLAAISHELRTPLNGIMGYAEYIHLHAQEAMTKFPAQVIFENSQYLLNLINSLLDLTKVEAGQMSLSPTFLNLRDEVEGVMNVHAARAATRKIDLHLAWDPRLPVQGWLDPLRFKQVVNNLLDNAIKYSANDSEIKVRVDSLEAEGQVKVSVQDHGTGIPADKHSEVFQKFWQNEDFVTRQHPGSGLGLALCKRLVELMGGQIGFTSAPRAGSTFFFTLPLGQGQGESA